MPTNALPIILYKGKHWFVDERLGEIRNVEDPADSINPIPKYDVHIFAVVRVKVSGVSAASQKEAIARAEDMIELHHMRCQVPGADDAEYAEEIIDFLVDEIGDTEYEKSRWYTGRGNRRRDGAARLPEEHFKGYRAHRKGEA